METMFLAAMLTSPTAIIICIFIVLMSSFLIYKNSYFTGYFSPSKFAGGYFGILIACALIAVAAIYVSPEESVSVYHVNPADYWNVIRSEFLTIFIVLTYFAFIGAAIFGLPIVYVLAIKDRASVPNILLASIVISIVVVSIIALVSDQSLKTLKNLILPVLSIHLFTTFGFCVGASFPWTLSRVNLTHHSSGIG